MLLHFSPKFCIDHTKALWIMKKEQPKVWKSFCFEVSHLDCFFLKKSNLFMSLFLQKKHKQTIKSSTRKYLDWWTEKNHEIINFLEGVFSIKLNIDIKAHVCITPLYTRNIIKKRFIIPTNLPKQRFTEIILHELSHFFFFSRLSLLKIKPNYHMWYVSEIIVPFLLKKFFNDGSFNNYVMANNLQQETIKKWINGQLNFKQMISSIEEGI